MEDFFQFIESNGLKKVIINGDPYLIENDRQIKNVIGKVLLNEIKLDNTNRNQILTELRKRLK